MLDAHADGFQFAAAESVAKEFSGCFGLQAFLFGKGRKVGFPLLAGMAFSVFPHRSGNIGVFNKALDEFLFAAQFHAGIDGCADGCKDGLVLALGSAVFFHQHEDIVDIDLHLSHKLHFKDDI